MEKWRHLQADNRLWIASRFESQNMLLRGQLTWQRTRNSKLSAENESLRSSLEEMLEEKDEWDSYVNRQKERVYDLEKKLEQSQSRVSLEIARNEELLSNANEKLEKKVQTGKQCHEEVLVNAEDDKKSFDLSLRDRIQRLERHNLELQDENVRLKTQTALDKKQHMELVLSSNRAIEEQNERHRQLLEECRQQLQSAADNRILIQSQLESENMLLKGQLTVEWTQNSQLSAENERLCSIVSDLEKEISGKNTELLADVDRLLSGVEYTNLRPSSEEGGGQLKEDLCERIKALEGQVGEDRARYTAQLDLWQQEIHSLRHQVELKDAEMKKIKEDERQRALVLQEAMLRYLRQPLSV